MNIDCVLIFEQYKNLYQKYRIIISTKYFPSKLTVFALLSNNTYPDQKPIRITFFSKKLEPLTHSDFDTELEALTELKNGYCAGFYDWMDLNSKYQYWVAGDTKFDIQLIN